MEKSSQLAVETIVENEDAFEVIDYLIKILCENHLEMFYKYSNYQARLKEISKLAIGISDPDIRNQVSQLADYKEEDRIFALEYNELLQAISEDEDDDDF